MSDTGALNALYKVAYAKGIQDLIPRANKFAKTYDFVPSAQMNG